jgi:hypothetical protein
LDVAHNKIANVKRHHENQDEQNDTQVHFPVKITGAAVQYSQDFKDDKLKHGARKCKSHREDHLYNVLTHLIVLKQLAHEEKPSKSKKKYLGGDHDAGVYQETHEEV